MRKDLQNQLIARFPTYFRNFTLQNKHTEPAKLDIPDGWFNILFKACTEIERIEESQDCRFQWVKLTEKEGRLDMFTTFSRAHKDILKVLSLLEEKSTQTCCLCSNQGEIVTFNPPNRTFCSFCKRNYEKITQFKEKEAQRTQIDEEPNIEVLNNPQKGDPYPSNYIWLMYDGYGERAIIVSHNRTVHSCEVHRVPRQFYTYPVIKNLWYIKTPDWATVIHIENQGKPYKAGNPPIELPQNLEKPKAEEPSDPFLIYSSNSTHLVKAQAKEADDEITPKWCLENGALQIGPNTYLWKDLKADIMLQVTFVQSLNIHKTYLRILAESSITIERNQVIKDFLKHLKITDQDRE